MPELLMPEAEVGVESEAWMNRDGDALLKYASREAEKSERLVAMSEHVIETVVMPAFDAMRCDREEMSKDVRSRLRAAAWVFESHEHEAAYAEYCKPDLRTPAAAIEMNIIRRTERLLTLETHPFLKDFARDFMNALPPQGLDRLLSYIEAMGWETAEHFFRDYQDAWKGHPENHGDILTRFYYNAVNAQQRALDTFAHEPMSMDPHEEKALHGVDITVEGVKENPFLRDEYADVLAKAQEKIGEKDDKDFTMSKHMSDTLERPMESGVARAIGRALIKNDRDTLFALLEQDVFPDKGMTENGKRYIRTVLTDLAELWADDTSSTALPEQEHIASAREKRTNVEKGTPLPESAEPIRIVNQRLNRKRNLPAFTELLHREMAESAVALAVNTVLLERIPYDSDGEHSRRRVDFLDQMIELEIQARTLYQGVRSNGVPVFRDYIKWINTEHAKLGALYPGEFYVGRDTYGTLFTAANAARWGHIDGKRRHAMTVHVNVSRDLAANVHNKERAHGRAMLRDWLTREGITLDMFGVDGGFSGKSPAVVFKALDPERAWSKDDLDTRIRLVETEDEHKKRRFNPAVAYAGIVSWMEHLPKFTDRSQMIAANEFGKYYVIAKRRSPAERTLAWTVQHAVWRELIDHEPLVEKLEK